MNESQFPQLGAAEIARANRQSFEHSPGARIEEFMLTPRGHKFMEDLIDAIDGIGDRKNSEINGIAGKVKALLDHADKDKRGRFAQLLLSEDGVQRLNALEYIEPFRDNPAMDVCLQLIDRAHYEGADDVEQLYKHTLTLLANITRYELLNKSYDPESPEWLDRAQHIVYIHGGEGHTQYLPNHPDNPFYSKKP